MDVQVLEAYLGPVRRRRRVTAIFGTTPIMDTQIIEQSVLQRAEAFVDTVVTPRVAQTPREDPRTRRARAEMGREDSDAGLRALRAAGLDLDRLDALVADRSQARRERLQQAHQRAVAGSAEAERRLAGLAPARPLVVPETIMIQEVTFIRSFAGEGVVYASSINPLDSWAQYGLDASGDSVGESGLGRLSFFTLWQNQQTDPVILTAGAQLVVNANLSVDADANGVASWFLPDSEAKATVGTRTTVWGMDSSVSSIVQESTLASDSVNGGFFGGDDSDSITFNGFLNASGVLVPAKAWSLIEVSILTQWYALDGSVHLDAHNGKFKVTVPWLMLTVS
jgi:hypothetical protein